MLLFSTMGCVHFGTSPSDRTSYSEGRAVFMMISRVAAHEHSALKM